MSVFDIEQIKRELSVYDPLEPGMIKAIRTLLENLKDTNTEG